MIIKILKIISILPILNIYYTIGFLGKNYNGNFYKTIAISLICFVIISLIEILIDFKETSIYKTYKEIKRKE